MPASRDKDESRAYRPPAPREFIIDVPFWLKRIVRGIGSRQATPYAKMVLRLERRGYSQRS